MLETPSGRQTLSNLGRELVRQREARIPSLPFHGDVAHMEKYVHHFLDRVRSDMPEVYVVDMSLLDMASTEKLGWDINLHNFMPKMAAYVNFNTEVRFFPYSYQKINPGVDSTKSK